MDGLPLVEASITHAFGEGSDVSCGEGTGEAAARCGGGRSFVLKLQRNSAYLSGVT